MRSLFEDQKLTLKDCVERFDKLEIPYMLTGSMAMVNYAMMRLTNDIDIVIQIDSEDANRIAKEFSPDYYFEANSIRNAVYRKSMFNILHQKTIVKIDCVMLKDSEFHRHAFSRRQKITVLDIDLWIIEKNDLILSKMNWARTSRSEMQMRDVASIIRNGYDEDYVEMWANKLGIIGILDDCKELLKINYAEGHDEED